MIRARARLRVVPNYVLHFVIPSEARDLLSVASEDGDFCVVADSGLTRGSCLRAQTAGPSATKVASG